jgi:hypothetical protein
MKWKASKWPHLAKMVYFWKLTEMKYLWIHVYISPYYACKCSVLQRIRFIIKISESISTVGYKLKELFSDGMCGDCVEAQIYFIFEIVIQKAIISLPLLYLSVETKSRALRLSSVRHLRLSLNKTFLSLYLSPPYTSRPLTWQHLSLPKTFP